MLEAGIGILQFHDGRRLASDQRFPVLGNAFDVNFHVSLSLEPLDHRADRFEPNLRFIACSTPRGTKSLTCPSIRQISFTCRELIKVYSSFVIKKMVSMSGSNLRFIRASWNSNSKSETARNPRTTAAARLRRA